MNLRKPSMNYRYNLDECLIILNYFMNLPNFRILFSGLLNLLLPKLLESYDIKVDDSIVLDS